VVAAIQTFGELLHWHPHIHALVTCGECTPEGDFLEVFEFDLDRLRAAWQEAVFARYLAEDKIEPEVVEDHARVAAQRLQRGSVGVPAGPRPVVFALERGTPLLSEILGRRQQAFWASGHQRLLAAGRKTAR
jgi:hypothetical protein